MVLNTQQDDYYYSLVDRYSAGFLIQFLDQHEVTLVSELGLAVQPGTANSIALQSTEVSFIGPN